MKCNICSEAEATIHFKELRNDEMRELHLCSACAAEKGFHSQMEKDKMSLANQFIWMAENLASEGGARIGQVQCESCGLRYSDFSRTGRFGCAGCYASFHDQVRRILRRIHGSTRHAGRAPASPRRPRGPKAALRQLQEELQRAIASENFELAAELRDRIRAIEAKGPRGESRK